MDPQVRPKILCVDDTVTQLEIYAAVLGTVGTVTCCESPEAAREKMRDTVFDLIVLDVMMPVTNGFELATEIRHQFPQQQGAPIVFVSAMDRAMQLENAKLSGGEDFLTKPVAIPELLEKVAQLLRVSGITDPYERHQTYLKIVARWEGSNAP